MWLLKTLSFRDVGNALVRREFSWRAGSTGHQQRQLIHFNLLISLWLRVVIGCGG